jgi:hypothetical protein
MNFDPDAVPTFVDDQQQTLVTATDGGETADKTGTGTERGESSDD